MFTKHFKHLSLAASLALGFTLVGCLQGEDGAKETPTTNIRVRANVSGLVSSGSVLAKGNTIAYSKLIVILTSNSNTPTASDTIRDTIRAGVSQGFTSNSTVDQTIDSNYTLKALRNWTVRILVRDTKDSLTHDTTLVPAASNFTRIGDTVSLVIGTLHPRYTQYRAVFSGLPDSVATTVTGNKQAVRFSRLVLRVDGKIVRDSLKADYFNSLPLDTLDYDYVLTGSHVIRLAAYGSLLNAAGTIVRTDTLFVGETTLNTASGVDASNSFSLAWTNIANNMGNEKVSVTVGRVGRTTVTGSTATNVVPKGRY